MSPLLNDAYTALRADRRADAQRAYEQLLRTEPRNIDALLGLAAIATTEGRSDEATRRYLQILELDPRNTLAQSGLIALLGRADPLAAESRLKQLIAREPSAYLYFTLGNLYADQSQWAAGAAGLLPGPPPRAGQSRLRLQPRRRARARGPAEAGARLLPARSRSLPAPPGRAHFNVAQAQQRIGRLASQVE